MSKTNHYYIVVDSLSGYNQVFCSNADIAKRLLDEADTNEPEQLEINQVTVCRDFETARSEAEAAEKRLDSPNVIFVHSDNGEDKRSVLVSGGIPEPENCNLEYDFLYKAGILTTTDKPWLSAFAV